jgi:hypothetical protein
MNGHIPGPSELLIIIAVLVAGICARVHGQQRALTPSNIEAAIKWGESGEAAPYLLHHAQ